MNIDTVENAILTAKLIDNPDKIHSIETTIALALAYVPSDTLPHPETLLVVSSGEKITELALLEIPIDPCTLSCQMITLSRFTYGGKSYEQDILSQLIYPHWSAFLPPEFSAFEILQAGSVDESLRERLRTQLETHPLGKPLQEAAKLTRQILEERSELTSPVTDHLWTVNREDLETRVVVPFVATLLREIDNLLEKSQKIRSDLTGIIFSGDLFADNWPLFSTRLTAQFFTDTTLHPPSTEAIDPVLIGLGRFPLYPSLWSTRGNND